jgi:nickel transport protein
MRRKPEGTYVFSLFLLVTGLLLPAALFGHGVEVYDVGGENRPVQTIYFRYSTGEPMSFAKIKIFPPSTAERNVESLVSITDRNGMFSFIPDEEGEWRADIEDGMGHKGNITVNTGTPTSNVEAVPVTSKGKLSLPVSIIFGLSLMINLFALWFFTGNEAKRRRSCT